MKMSAREVFWFNTLQAAAGRASNGGMDGLPMCSLEDSELERVFGQCANPILLIEAVKAWRESGRSFSDFMRLEK